MHSYTDIQSKVQWNTTELDNPLAMEPVEGGPKTVELLEDPVEMGKILEVLDLSLDLTMGQRHSVKQVIFKNLPVFALDGQLWNYLERIDIPVKPRTEPVSLPPFPSLPAKQEAIDKQMDQWIQLGVIELLKSPWGAPAFIVYWNGKPCMVVNLQRLNESVINNKFPLLRQDDILQTLNSAQWLTTLDALAGFTQLTMTPSASEKLTFRMHRGLLQFNHMPFGYCNGPGIF